MPEHLISSFSHTRKKKKNCAYNQQHKHQQHNLAIGRAKEKEFHSGERSRDRTIFILHIHRHIFGTVELGRHLKRKWPFRKYIRGPRGKEWHPGVLGEELHSGLWHPGGVFAGWHIKLNRTEPKKRKSEPLGLNSSSLSKVQLAKIYSKNRVVIMREVIDWYQLISKPKLADA